MLLAVQVSCKGLTFAAFQGEDWNGLLFGLLPGFFPGRLIPEKGFCCRLHVAFPGESLWVPGVHSSERLLLACPLQTLPSWHSSCGWEKVSGKKNNKPYNLVLHQLSAMKELVAASAPALTASVALALHQHFAEAGAFRAIITIALMTTMSSIIASLSLSLPLVLLLLLLILSRSFLLL